MINIATVNRSAGLFSLCAVLACAPNPSPEPADPVPDSAAAATPPAGAGAAVVPGQASGAGVATVSSVDAARTGAGAGERSDATADARARTAGAAGATRSSALDAAEMARRDSARSAMVAMVLGRIAGREDEPAGRVFRNVQLLRDMPARDFLRVMSDQYTAGLGFSCANCHNVERFDSDERVTKRIARDMQRMTSDINRQYLARSADLDPNSTRATCVMCHQGSSQPPVR